MESVLKIDVPVHSRAHYGAAGASRAVNLPLVIVSFGWFLRPRRYCTNQSRSNSLPLPRPRPRSPQLTAPYLTDDGSTDGTAPRLHPKT